MTGSLPRETRSLVMQPGYEEREIVGSLSERALPPERVFHFPLVDTWRDRVWRMLGDVVTEDVRVAFIDDPPEYVVSDDLSWLDDIILAVTGVETNIKDLAAKRLREEFEAFRAGHGTRTNDLVPFYQRGLCILRAEEIENRARSIFLNGSFANASEARLEAAIEELDARNRAGGREGFLYFCACENELFEDHGAGHYLIYGSEYLYCLGIRVTSVAETKKALTAIGRPTLFICDIPMAMIHDGTLREFAGMVLEYLFCELVYGLEADALSPGAGSALSLREDLPAKCIVGHYHPTKIYDPLRFSW